MCEWEEESYLQRYVDSNARDNIVNSNKEIEIPARDVFYEYKNMYTLLFEQFYDGHECWLLNERISIHKITCKIFFHGLDNIDRSRRMKQRVSSDCI